jgi:GMP synthase-like glutamine amidotransferase
LPDYYVDTSSIVILDFGSQYTQLIARRIREQNVFSVVLPRRVPHISNLRCGSVYLA